MASNERTAPTPARRWVEFGILLLLFGGVLAAKFPHLIAQPRLYAEEGLFFLQNAVLGAGPEALFIHFQGYLNILNGMTALTAAAWIPPEYWAIAHQSVAFSIQAAVVFYIALMRLNFLPTLAHKSVFVVALAMIPPAAETALTSTNMHFWAVVPVVCMLFDDARDYRPVRLRVDSGVIGLTGLIGPPVAVFFPAMLVKALLSRARLDRIRCLVLFGVLVFQLISMMTYRAYWGDGADRAIFDIALQALMILPWEILIGSVTLIAAGFEASETLARATAQLSLIWLVVGATAFYGVVLSVLLVIRHSSSFFHGLVMLVAVGGVVAGSLFSYPHDAVDTLSIVQGGRYTLLVNFVLLGAAALMIASVTTPWRWFGSAALLGLLSLHASADRIGEGGADWREEVAAWRAGDRSCGLQIEPEGWRIGIGEDFRAELEDLVGTGNAPILERVADWRVENGMLRRPALAPKIFERLCREGSEVRS